MTQPPEDDFYNGKEAGDFVEESAPMALFHNWMKDAEASEVNDPTAMSVATVDEDGMPDVRMILLKDADDKGFVFYTNFESAKGGQLLSQPKAALCFHWKSLRRQVRVRGLVTQVSDQEADDYYNSRARGSRIGAWASQQSRPLESRFALEKAVTKFGAKYAIGAVPRPSYWSGFRITPIQIEFWHDRPFRLHDRVVFSRTDEKAEWTKERLYP